MHSVMLINMQAGVFASRAVVNAIPAATRPLVVTDPRALTCQ